ncbi:hypothetical protein SCHPADRAFT_897808 [Schizopora paradoxa]|uniref:Chromo domain-containing protein n=1 Tax=Schizopora paradoxa TaxID=27342 RepID=A0A0H2S9K1_9AGAM|nr:hypothetical protein SCHPADRAFT_897808 [Schizopora paradoxa]
MGKRKEIVEDESEEDPESSFYVEVITKARVVEGGKFWWSYPDSDNTWEPYENVKGCTRLLKSFWKEVGKDKRKNPGPVGEEYVASEKWIKTEKLIFQRDMDKNTDVDKSNDVIDLDQEDEEDEEEKKPAEVARKPERKEHKPKEPVPSSSKALLQTKAEGSRTKVVQISDSDSEDDKPLKKKAKSEKTKTKPSVPEVRKNDTLEKLNIRKKASASVTSSVASNDDGRREAESALSASKGKFSNLKIKKKLRVETNNANDKSEFTLNSAPPLTADEINVHRPKPIERRVAEEINLLDSDVYGSLFLPSQSQQDVPAESAPPDIDAAENFLETISSRTAAAALKPSELAKAEALKAAMPPPPPRPVYKKWTWDGELFVKSNQDFADRLCNVRFEDITDVSGDGFKFDVLMDGKDSIRFDRLYTMFEMRTILRALRRVDQFASMCHTGPADRDALLTFKTFMRDKNLAARTPVMTDFGHVAEMIVFPVESELSGLLSVPLSLSNHAMCIVALMPWAVRPSAYKPLGKYPSDKVERRSREEIEDWSNALAPTRVTSQLVDDLKLLAFPKWLINMVRDQQYCVWARSVEPIPQEYGKIFARELRPETAALFNVLTALGAKNVGYRHDLIFVFVHVGALDTLNYLEALPERRSKRPEIRFFTYGRHNCVKPDLWGLHEIYSLGGVVTFTPKALLEDPFGCANLIMKLHKHPLWLSYMLPSVLAVFIKFTSMPSNPIEAFSTEPFRFGRILHLILDGSISVMESPPLVEQPKTATEPSPSDEWIVTQLKSLRRTLTDIVEESWRIFISQFSNKSDPEIYTALEGKINDDLIRMQMQPSMRSTYRRYVIIKAESEKHISCYKGGFEWETMRTFKIRDDFFGKEQPPNNQQAKK